MKKSNSNSRVLSILYLCRTLIIFAFFMIFIAYMGSTKKHEKPESTRYYLEAELSSSDEINGNYIFVDQDGNEWGWFDDMYIYDQYHVYLLSMDDNKTPNDISDDILLTVWSNGGTLIEIPYYG